MNLDQTYRVGANVVVERRGQRWTVGGGDGCGVYVANDLVADFLRRLDGATTLRGAFEQIATSTGVPVHRVVEDFRSPFREMVARGLLTAGTPSYGEAPQASSIERFSHVYLEMTSKCNLRCKHCYMEGGPSLPNELRLPEWLDVIEQFSDLGGAFLTLSGGEPLLYSAWPLLAERGRQRGLRLSLMSNGAYLDRKVLDLIRAYDITLGLGLDGAKAETHDYNRGRGSFTNTMRALRMMLDDGLYNRVTLCFTAMRRNVYDLPLLIDRMVELQLPRLYVSLLEDRGRAERFWDQLQPTEDQRRWLLEYLYDRSCELLGTLEIEVTHHVDIFRRLVFDEPDGPDHDRRHTVRVTSDGEVFMSAYMGAPEHCLGSTKVTSLREMLGSDIASRILAEWDTRTERISKCRSCVYQRVCRGGSGVLAYSEHGHFEEPDGYCDARIHLFDSLVARRAALERTSK
jgi:radical SAM protein with 4Fe4S-binding SPASM domain